LVTISDPDGPTDVKATSAQIQIAWLRKTRDTATAMDNEDVQPTKHNQSLVRSIVRAQAWVQSLEAGTFESIEALAQANRLHPKVVRQALRLAFSFTGSCVSNFRGQAAGWPLIGAHSEAASFGVDRTSVAPQLTRRGFYGSARLSCAFRI
jgi:hypothetical protein